MNIIISGNFDLKATSKILETENMCSNAPGKLEINSFYTEVSTIEFDSK